MKIRQLLEADIYRFQSEWLNQTDEPVIQMAGRDNRRPIGSSPYQAYVMALGMELNGIECPRRWRSTFATTNIDGNEFLSGHTENMRTAIRKLNLPAGTKIGTITDDFNTQHLEGQQAGHGMYYCSGEIIKHLNGKQDPVSNQLRQQVEQWRTAYFNVEDESVASDRGYEMFKALAPAMDKIIMQDAVDVRWLPALIVEFGSITNAIKECHQKDMSSGLVRVFDSVDAIPDSKLGLEVWFEGDYTAELVDWNNQEK